MFETGPNGDEYMRDFHYVLSIEPRNREVYVELYFACDIGGKYQVAIFTPYIIEHIIEPYPDFESSDVDWNFSNSESGSIVYATFYVEQNGTQRHRSIGVFTVSNSITYQNFGMYTLDFPLGSYYPIDLQKLKESLNLQVFGTNLEISGQIWVALPRDAVVLEKSHEIHSRSFSLDNQTVIFLLSKQENLFLQYNIPSQVNDAQNDLFFSGILIGLGLSTIITSLLELIMYNWNNRRVIWQKRRLRFIKRPA